MMGNMLEDRIKNFITTNFYVADASSLDLDDSFLDRGIVDSTGVLEVISFVEDEFGIQVSDDEMLPENLDSVRRLAAFVTRKKAACSA